VSRVPFVVWLVPGIVVLPLLSGRWFTAPGWVKVGLAVVAIALPTVLVLLRYRSEPDPDDVEFARRRRAAFAIAILAVVSATWMVGGVDVATELPLDPGGNDESVRYDVTVVLPPGGSLRDLEPVGSGVRAFFPRPDNPRIHRLLLAQPLADGEIDLLVKWRLPVWRSTGDVSVSVVPVAEGG
jgi:hypothetical protein